MKFPSLVVAMLAVCVAACSSNPKKEEDKDGAGSERDRSELPEIFRDRSDDPLAERRKERRLAELSAEQLYRRARSALDSSDFTTAVENYDRLSSQHPYSPFATQGDLERIYALYRNFEPDRALSGADRFLREHPRHPAVDYVYYLKGLVNFHRDETGLTILPIDETKSDVTSQRRAFDDFSLLIQRFPGSRYAGDAYDRMVFIRNRIAAHELHVVDFYVRRGAYVAAAKRAEQIIGQYPGTPASYRALELLVQCYELAGLEQQAQDARTLLEGQPAPVMMVGISASGALEAARAEAETRQSAGFLGKLAGLLPSVESTEGVDILLPSESDAPLPSATPPSTDTSALPIPPPETLDVDADDDADDGSVEVFYEPPATTGQNDPAPVQP